MALPKKNQMTQITFLLVDRTDFASIESAITASDFDSQATKKGFGYNHGGSAAVTSFTISKLTSLVRSGILRQTLKATECNYDRVHYSFRGHASCADQHIILDFANNDDSDIMSVLSDILSRVPKRVATDSQLSDLASDLRSFLTNMSAILSDLTSAVSDLQSDFQSRVPKRVATDSQLSDLVSDLNSDLRSFMNVGVPLTASDISDLRSAIAAGPAATITASDISDIASAVWANTIGARVDSRVLLNLSRISDVYSLLSDHHSDTLSLLTTTGIKIGASDMSDLRSAITAGPPATVTASDISDIASAVWANTIGVRVDSRVLLNLSRISDTYSGVSDLLSEFLSRVTGVIVTSSDMASQIWNTKYTNASNVKASTFGSLARLNMSRISDLQSQLSDAHSDLRSYLLGISASVSDLQSALSDHHSDMLSLLGTTGVALNPSTISDIRSAITAGPGAVLTVSDISDIASAVWGFSIRKVTSNIGLNASDMSDLRSAITAGPAGVLTTSDISDIGSRVWSDPLGAAVSSRVLLNLSRVSDIASYLVALSDAISNIDSALTSQFNYTSGALSDTYSSISDLQSDLQSRIGGQIAIKKNKALNNFEFQMQDTSGNFATGLTVAANRSIDGAAFALAANAVTEVGNGIYKINLAATDLNGDMITFRFSATGAKDTFKFIVTQP